MKTRFLLFVALLAGALFSQAPVTVGRWAVAASNGTYPNAVNANFFNVEVLNSSATASTAQGDAIYGRANFTTGVICIYPTKAQRNAGDTTVATACATGVNPSLANQKITLAARHGTTSATVNYIKKFTVSGTYDWDIVASNVSRSITDSVARNTVRDSLHAGTGDWYADSLRVRALSAATIYFNDSTLSVTDSVNRLITANVIATPQNASPRANYVYDFFARANHTLHGEVTPTGDTWSCTGPAGATVRILNGLVVSDSNFYCWLPYGAATPEVNGTVSFVPGSGDNDNSKPVTLIAGQGSDLGTMLHLEVGPTACALSKRVGGGSFDFIYNRTYFQKVAVDGTPKAVSMSISGDSVTVVCADGVPATVTNAAIGTTIVPTHIGIQTLPTTNGYVGRWNSVGMGYFKTREISSLGGAATAAELYSLQNTVAGDGLQTMYNNTETVFATASWCRIAEGAALSAPGLMGQVFLAAGDVTGGGGIIANVGDYLNNAQQINGMLFESYFSPITKLRLTRETSGSYRHALDFYKTRGDNMNLTLTLKGIMNPVSPINCGVSAYDQTTELDLPTGLSTTGAMSAAGYYITGGGTGDTDTFTTSDGKTVTVTGGIITDIVGP